MLSTYTTSWDINDSRLSNTHSRIEYLENFRHDIHLEVSDSM